MLFLSLTDHRIKRNFNFLPLTHPIFSFLHTKAAADNHVVIKKHKKFQIIYATLNKRNKRYHLTLQWLNKPVLLKWQRQEIPSNTKKNSVWESIAPLESRLFTQFRMGVGQIDLPTSFSTVTFTNAWISSQSFMTFIFNPFATLVWNRKAIPNACPKLLSLKLDHPSKKVVFLVKSFIKLRTW